MKLRYKLLCLFALMSAPILACGVDAEPTSVPVVSTATAEPAADDGAVEESNEEPAEEAEPVAEVEETEPEPTATPEPEPTATPEPEPTEAPKETQLGEISEADGYSMVVLQVEDPAPGGAIYTPVEGMKLLGVEVIIGNVSGDMQSINALSGTLIDTDGFAHEAEIFGRDETVDLVNLNPGERVRGWLSFTVPEEAAADRLKFQVSAFPEIVLESNLTTATGETVAPTDEVAISNSGAVTRDVVGKLGDLLEQDGYSLVAQTIEDPTANNGFVTVPDGYRLMSVEIVVGNVSGEQVTTNALNATLVDSDGFVYPAEAFGRDGSLDLTDLEAGLRAKGWVSFVIPADAVVESLRYQISGFPFIEIRAGLSE